MSLRLNEASWISLLVVGQSYRLSRLAYLKELHTRYAPHLEGLQFSDLVAECKKILTCMVEMLKRKAVKAVDNSESEPEVDDNPEPKPEVYDNPESGPKVIAELVSQ